MSALQVDKDVTALLKEHAYLQVVEVGEGDKKRVRVRCDLTQHELLPRKSDIESYLKTKKFLKAKEWYCYDYTKFEPYIVPHRRKTKSLFCNVTDTILNRIPSEVEKHVNGKKFQRLKQHVNFTGGKDGEGDVSEFNANAFEFENKQLLYSDEEDENGNVITKKKSVDDEEEEEEDDDEDDEEDEDDDLEEEDEDDEEDAAEDDVMAEFYPQEEEEDDEDEHIREAVKRLTMKKRKASTDASGDDTSDGEEKKAPQSSKKQKQAAVSEPSKKASKAPKGTAAAKGQKKPTKKGGK